MARIISKRILDDIRFRNDIAEVVGATVPLKRSGVHFKACCPFHQEKTPSFNVNTQKQIYHCFGCGKGGDVFSFVMEREGIDFMAAARMLAERAGIALELEGGDEGAARSHREELLAIHAELAAFYRRCLEQMRAAAVARDYLAGRDLGSDIVEAFGIGYAPNRWDAAVRWAVKHRHPLERMAEAGLVILRDPANPDAGYYDRFRNRLMFPIRDIQGRTIGFSGRALDAADQAKYLNSPETPLFRKSRVLYALDAARRALVETREAIVCEGQIDVIRCHAAGFRQAVAAQGTAFTEDHARVLRRYADGVALVFDADPAGRNAAIKTAGIFFEAGLGVRVAVLPAGDDPDSFIRSRGAEAFADILSRACPAVDFLIDVVGEREDLRSDVGSMRAARAVVELIAHSSHAVQQTRLIQRAAERLQLPVAALQEELRGARRPVRPGERPAPASAAAGPGAPAAERTLCEALVQPETAAIAARAVAAYVPPALLRDACCRRLVKKVRRAGDDPRALEHVLEDDAWSAEEKTFLAGVLMAPVRVGDDTHPPERAVQDVVLALWRAHLSGERKRRLRAGKTAAQREVVQIALDLAALKKWETGVDVIELAVEAMTDSPSPDAPAADSES